MAFQKITKRLVDSATPQSLDSFLWDSELKGFGLKITANGKKTYVCQYRTPGGRSGKTRRYTIGAHGSPWTADAARQEARRVLGLVATGGDPVADAREFKNRLSIADLCDDYLLHGCTTKKKSTLSTDRGRIARHIKPLIGNRHVQDFSKSECRRFLSDVEMGKSAVDVRTGKRGRAIVRGGRGTATRTLGLLGAIFSYAVECGLISTNPVSGVKRFPYKSSNRYLTHIEFGELGAAIRRAELAKENPFGLAIIRLLVLTGARKGEIEGLKWSEVNLNSGYLELADSKTGQKRIPLNLGAREVICQQNGQELNTYVFPAQVGNGHYVGTPKVWRRLRHSANLNGVRMHDLRHSFATLAASGGASLPIIGALLGHKDSKTTSRYAHLFDDPVRKVSESVGDVIAQSMAASDTTSNDTPVMPFPAQ